MFDEGYYDVKSSFTNESIKTMKLDDLKLAMHEITNQEKILKEMLNSVNLGIPQKKKKL